MVSEKSNRVVAILKPRLLEMGSDLSTLSFSCLLETSLDLNLDNSFLAA